MAWSNYKESFDSLQHRVNILYLLSILIAISVLIMAVKQ